MTTPLELLMTMRQRDRCKGKRNHCERRHALDLDEHFDVIALMLEPLASCCVCLYVWGGGAAGHVALIIML